MSKDPISWDRSLYSSRPLNAASRAYLDALNEEAARLLPRHLYEGEWGCRTSIRAKKDYLDRYLANRPGS